MINQKNKNDDENIIKFSINDIINNSNYSIGFDILNNDIDKIDLDKISKNENQILELFLNEGIISISKQDLNNQKFYTNDTIRFPIP